jgi:probable phosphoglycerate mutase
VVPAERVVLIRHGESEWNATGRWQGHGGVGLSPLGRKQADATAAFLAEHEPDVGLIAASDLPRVTETAAPSGRALGREVRVDRRLREIDVGWWSGLTTAEIVARDPNGYAAFRAGQDVPRGGAETDEQLRARVSAAVEDLRQQCDGRTMIVFCHGGPVRALIGVALGLSVEGQRLLGGPGNCSRSVVTHHEGTMRVRCYNETAHVTCANAAATG